MKLHLAQKLVIITESLVSEGVCEIIEACGASGFTVVAAGGKGSRNMPSTSERASVVEGFANVKIEVIVNERDAACAIMERVAERYLRSYSGIMYIEPVEILRPSKFGRSD